LRDAGYVEGRNLTIEYRFAENHYERLPALRREEDAAGASLRPQLLAEFIGQEQARSNSSIYCSVAKPAAFT
jgi:Holliday junction resolvasome RuvABC ATP-dependent DNA helicase subunit